MFALERDACALRGAVTSRNRGPSALFLSAHNGIEVTQETMEGGGKSRTVSWPAREFIVSQDTPGGLWTVYDVQADVVIAIGATGDEALMIAAGEHPAHD